MVHSLMPPGEWQAEWLVGAGEGGRWQAEWDPHHLAVDGPEQLAWLVARGRKHDLQVTAYVVVRGRAESNAAEHAQIARCAEVCGRVVLYLADGREAWNGPTTPDELRTQYLGPLLSQVPRAALELCAMPRDAAIANLGGRSAMRTWLEYVGSACWQCYDATDPDLQVSVAIPRVDRWAPSEPRPDLRIPVVQRSRIAAWAGTGWAGAGLQVWNLSGE